MTIVLYAQGLKKMLEGVAGMNLLGDLRLALVMTDTTIFDENDDVEFLDDFTDLDEMDDGSYARIALAAATPSVSHDTTRNSIKLVTADHPVFPNLDPGTRNVQGVLLYWHVLGDDAQSVPLAGYKYTTPRVPFGEDFTVELPTGKVLGEWFHGPAATVPIVND